MFERWTTEYNNRLDTFKKPSVRICLRFTLYILCCDPGNELCMGYKIYHTQYTILFLYIIDAQKKLYYYSSDFDDNDNISNTMSTTVENIIAIKIVQGVECRQIASNVGMSLQSVRAHYLESK